MATSLATSEENTSEVRWLNTKNTRNLLGCISIIYGFLVWDSMESGSTNDWAEMFNGDFKNSGAVEIIVALCFSLICCESCFGICFQCRSAAVVGNIEKTKEDKQVRVASLCCDCTSFWAAVMGLILIAAGAASIQNAESKMDAFWLALLALAVKILWNVLIWPTIARKYGNENAQASSELLPVCMYAIGTSVV